MTDQTDTRIDPRFDPAFQRGFTGAQAIPQMRRRHVLVEATPAPAAPEAGPPTAEGAEQGADQGAGQGAEHVAEADASMEPVIRGRRNPFLVALWVLGPVVMVAGGAAYWASNSMSWSTYGGAGEDMQLRQMLVTVLYISGVPMFAVGLATLAASLFWHAARGQRT